MILVLVVLTMVLIIIASAFLFVKSKLDLINYSDGKNEYDASIYEASEDSVELDLSELETVNPQKIPDEEVYDDDSVLNILILGTDERTVHFSDNARSDSMILLSLNRNGNTVKLVSLARGMGVPILEGPYKGQYDWLTHCFRYGGAALVMKEVQECFKVKVERFVRVNFNSVVKIVDLLGGISVNLTYAEAEYLNSINGNNLTEGYNILNGADALEYARCRKIDSDWQRVKRQQTVIRQCANKVKDANIETLNNLLNTALPMVQTNFTQREMAKYMMWIPDFLVAQFESITVPVKGTYGSMTGMGGRNMYAPNYEENSRILKEFLYS